MQSRQQFWLENWESDKNTNSVHSPYCKAFHLDESDLAKINSLVFDVVYHSMPEAEKAKVGSTKNHEKIVEYLSQTKIFAIDVVNQLDKFTQLEQAILDSFKSQKFMTGVDAIQYPVDIRVVHPAPPPNYLEKRKAVDFLHTDAWRGEPPDVVNCVLYCAVNDKASQLVVYDVPDNGIEAFENYEGPEKEAGFLIAELPEVKFDHLPGEAIFFDAYSPHNTRRNGDEVRISLNFSFRRGNPYETLDEKWDRSEQPWGKYWYLPEAKTDSFQARCDQELKRLVQQGNTNALPWRQKVIQQLGKPRKLEELYA